MENVLGLIALIVIIIFAYLLSVKYPKIGTVIWGATFIRIITVLFHEFIQKLPDSLADAGRFENSTWVYSQLPFSDFLNSFNSGSKSYTFTWVLSFLYRAFGRSALMLESVNIIISLFCVILVYKIAWLLSNCDFRSKQSAAIFAFFPSIILYNIIILREVYIVLLILLFALYMLKWLKSKQIKFAIIAIILYIPMYFLHGGLIIGAVMFFIILVIASINDIISTLNKNRLLVPQLQFIFFCMFFLIFVFVRIDNLNIPYFGNTDQILNISKILYFAEVTNLGGSAYPSWLIPSSLSNFVLLIFPRLIYFLFSPFLWDIKAINHLLGFVDALLVITLFFFIIKGMLVKKPGKYVTILCIILLPLLITYSWGVGNFGTALRHRSKFIPVFIAISSIYVPIVKLRKNLKVYKPDE